MTDVAALVEGIRAGRRASVARAITLVESSRREHRAAARELLTELAGESAESVRVGISGVPGVGKSTFIETLGTRLTADGHRVGVLAVDPSSVRTGGSVLGDKTRMARLANDPDAFIRASPSAGTLGGVARATVQAMSVLEAAGYDVVLVETVGVGQSEVTVAGMVDTFLFLTLARTGDQLQGIKKGILELADLIAVNKADGEAARAAQRAAADYANALHLVTPPGATWQPPVVTCSALTGDGLDTIWDQIVRHRRELEATGEWEARRRDQQLRWMWAMVEDRLLAALRAHPRVATELADVETDVGEGRLTPTLAAARLLSAFGVVPAAGGTEAGSPQ